MSHSPTPTSGSSEILQYDKGWAAINRMLRAGRSFSGYEKDCCFLNTGGPRFACVSAATSLDFADDGRGMALCDWDRDGRQDIWVTCRTGPRVRFLVNRYDSGPAHWVQFRLTGDGRTSSRDAFGARIEVHPAAARSPKLIRTLHGGSGYLSQSSKWVHFGLGPADRLARVVVRWPGGPAEEFPGVAVDGFYDLKMGAGTALRWTPPALDSSIARHSSPVPPALSDKARVVVLRPMPLPPGSGFPKGRPRLINLWQSTCENCAAEFKEWGTHFDAMKALDVEFDILCVDPETTPEKVKASAAALGWPGPAEPARREVVEWLNVLQKSCIGRQADLPTPSTFLVDASGSVAVIYKGPVSTSQLARDVSILGSDSDTILAHAIPEPGGRWLEKPGGTAPRAFAVMLVENGYRDVADRYLRDQLPRYQTPTPGASRRDEEFRLTELAESHAFLGALAFDRNEFTQAVGHYQQSLTTAPSNRKLRLELVRTFEQLGDRQAMAAELTRVIALDRHDPESLARLGQLHIDLGQPDTGLPFLRESLALKPDKEVYFHLANALAARDDRAGAIDAWRRALALESGWAPAANNLAWTLATTRDDRLRNGAEALRLAEAAVKASDGRIPQLLGTLAAAYAESDRFDDATATIDKAIALAQSVSDAALVQSLREKQAAYRRRLPWRE